MLFLIILIAKFHFEQFKPKITIVQTRFTQQLSEQINSSNPFSVLCKLYLENIIFVIFIVKNEEKPPKIVPNHIIANVTVSKNSDTKPPFLSSQSSCLISATSNSTDSIETVPKLENGVLCGNARLQEAWEIERKGSPDAPWR